MTRFTDYNTILELEMRYFDEKTLNWSSDWSADFYEVGNLEYDEDLDAYVVDDNQYLVEVGLQWQDYMWEDDDPEMIDAEIAHSGIRVFDYTVE